MKWLVIYGNPVDGFRYCGPFDGRGDAFEWADDNVATEYDWWLAELNAPQGEGE